MPQNDKTNALHGGDKGFDKRIWKAEQVKDKGWVGVKLTYVSPDGEMGFPGTLKTEVTYSLNEKNELRIQYHATTDKPTVLNLTNHSYFNLAGAGNGDILDQVAMVKAAHYTPVNEKLIPTGELAPVAGTRMLLTMAASIKPALVCECISSHAACRPSPRHWPSKPATWLEPASP